MILTAEPVPSVAWVHLWIIEITASVVELPGIIPYWLGLIILKIAGAMYFVTAQSSAIFERAGISEIHLNSLLMSFTGLVFNNGTMLASFQDFGSCCST